MKRIFILMFLAGGWISLQAQNVEEKAYQELLNKYLKHDVREVDVDDLLNMKNYVLLDARSDEEYNVSHLKDAVHIDFVKFTTERLEDIGKNSVIVVYCSVGSRSEMIARLLKDAGYNKVFNLYGGIFEWSNRELPMYDMKNEPTKRIHGVTTEWAKWITHGEIVFNE
jgi:rhodanese-related sulfurtransferase